MSELVLTLRGSVPARLDASCIAPHRLATLSRHEIEKQSLRFEGGETLPLAELLAVAGEPSETARLVGDLSQVDCLGTGMAAGVLRIDGNAGHRLGRRMTGGRIEVTGGAGDDVGSEMSGGQIIAHGSVGKRTGAAGPGAKRGMTGGEIVIFGDAAEQTGAFMRRGVIAVGGRVGPEAAHAAIAGTLVALGDVAHPAARWMKRASLVALGTVPISPTYRYACTYRPSFVRVLLTYLRREYGFAATEEQVGGAYRRYSGDMAESDRGEILHWRGE